MKPSQSLNNVPMLITLLSQSATLNSDSNNFPRSK